MKKYIFASDHAGFELKEALIAYALNKGDEVIDLGTDNSKVSVSYVDYWFKLANAIKKNSSSIGIGICGTGLGISFALNRVKGIRAARVNNNEDAMFAKFHNNANVLAFGGRQISKEQAIKMIETFNETKYEGGRHQDRIDELDK